MSLYYSDNSTYLELLPSELQCQILKSIPDMKSLRALLCASPRYFQVYKASRETILSYVAWNHISPAIVPIALDALRRRKRLWLRRNHSQSPTPRIIPKEPIEISLKTWEKLLRFHAIVEEFISNFTTSRLVPLETALHLQTKSSLPHESSVKRLSLSQLEYARLARAFYNLDRYANPSYDNSDEFWPSFLEELRDWELEELLCVRSFMMERLRGYLNQFDDDFMEAFLKDMPHIIWPSKKTVAQISDTGMLSSRVNNWLQESWTEHFLTQGLPIISAIFSTNTLQGKLRVFQKLERRTRGALTMWDDISWALSHIPTPSEQELAAMMKSPEIGYYDNLEQPNEAWFWAMKVSGHPRSNITDASHTINKHNPVSGWDNHDLECWGYVIWDHERLKRLRILSKSPSDIVAIIGTDWRIKRSPMSLEERTRKQEEIWSRDGRVSTLTEKRATFDWENEFRSDPTLLGENTIVRNSRTNPHVFSRP